MTPEQENKLLTDAEEAEIQAIRTSRRTAIIMDLLMDDPDVDAESDLFKTAASLQAIAIRLKLVVGDFSYRTRRLICGEGDGN